jgi:excisionase family DNA binding protein
METEKEFYSPDEVGDDLTIAANTVRALVRKGVIPGIRAGSKYLIPPGWREALARPEVLNPKGD